jgi:hypothetical protein
LGALVIANWDANHFTRNDDFDAAIKLPASNRVVASDWIRLSQSHGDHTLTNRLHNQAIALGTIGKSFYVQC